MIPCASIFGQDLLSRRSKMLSIKIISFIYDRLYYSLTKKQSSALPLLKSNERPSKPRVVGRINKTKTLKKVENSVSSSENVNLSSSEEDINDKKIEKNHVDDDDLGIRQTPCTNDEEETKKSAKEIDDDRVKAQITKSTEEVDDDNKKKKMHKKRKDSHKNVLLAV